jgi:hypothetical protein
MAYITTVEKVKTIIPNQAVVNYLVKDYIFEQKIANVTIMLQAFLDTDYAIRDSLIASLLGISTLNAKHIGITNISNVSYINGEYSLPLVIDSNYIFRTFDFIVDEIYNVDNYTIAFSREFIEQIIYGGILEPKINYGYIQYTVIGGNDSNETFQDPIELLANTPFFMDNALQQIAINEALSSEGTLSPIIQLLAAYIVAKDIITEYILPVFKQDQANNLAGVQLNSQDLLPGFEEFLNSLDDKIADIWALLKYKGKITVNPDGPQGPEEMVYANKARTVVRGEKKYIFETPFNDAYDYTRRHEHLDNFLNMNNGI